MVCSLSIRANSDVPGSGLLGLRLAPTSCSLGQRISANKARQLSQIFHRISQDVSLLPKYETPFFPDDGEGMCPDTRT